MLFALLIVLMPTLSYAEVISWNSNPEPDLSSYTVDYSTDATTWNRGGIVPHTPGSKPSLRIDLPDNVKQVRVAATNEAGRSSVPSSIALPVGAIKEFTSFSLQPGVITVMYIVADDGLGKPAKLDFRYSSPPPMAWGTGIRALQGTCATPGGTIGNVHTCTIEGVPSGPYELLGLSYRGVLNQSPTWGEFTPVSAGKVPQIVGPVIVDPPPDPGPVTPSYSLQDAIQAALNTCDESRRCTFAVFTKALEAELKKVTK